MKKKIIIEYEENKEFNPTALWFEDAIFNYLRNDLEKGRCKDFLEGKHRDTRTILLRDSIMKLKVN